MDGHCDNCEYFPIKFYCDCGLEFCSFKCMINHADNDRCPDAEWFVEDWSKIHDPERD